MHGLFVSYDGLAEPLGRSQVLPYVLGLARRGARVCVLSFEKPADLERGREQAAIRAQLEQAGVVWLPLRYHRRPSVPATAYDVAQGFAAGAYLVKRHRLRLVHGRSYVASLIGLLLKRALGVRLLFDMRNFWADEKVDAGAWSHGAPVYRAAKQVERALLGQADHVVTLTERARQELASREDLERDATLARTTVIPTCVDLELFRPPDERPGRAPVLVYAGSLGGRYLHGELLAFAEEVRRREPATKLRVLTRSPVELLETARRAAGFPASALEVASASREEVARAFQRSHAGLSFLSEGYSNRSSAPTKLAEYLAAGLPLVVTPGVGDTDAIIAAERVGVIVRDGDLGEAAERLLELFADEQLAQRCRATAERHYALGTALDRYERIWRELGGAA